MRSVDINAPVQWNNSIDYRNPDIMPLMIAGLNIENSKFEEEKFRSGIKVDKIVSNFLSESSKNMNRKSISENESIKSADSKSENDKLNDKIKSCKKISKQNWFVDENSFIKQNSQHNDISENLVLPKANSTCKSNSGSLDKINEFFDEITEMRDRLKLLREFE